MRYQTFSATEQPSYPLCFLVPTIRKDEIQKEYLDAFAEDKLQSIYSYNSQFQARAQVATAFTVDYNFQPSFTVTVPEGHYYLLGDDRLVSSDSRIVGSFAKEDIQGKIVFRMWPLNRISLF